MARLLLVLVMAIGALARPQDNCEIFGDCPPPPSSGFDDELFGPEPAEDSACEIFGECTPADPPLDDELFGDDGPQEIEEYVEYIDPSNGVDPDDPYANLECFDTVNEIDTFEGDNGNVFNDCNPESECSDYAQEGYSCANAWNCNGDRKIITDGKGLIDVRGVDFTLDASDSKCPSEDQICCLRPNFRAPQPEVDKPLVKRPVAAIIKDNEDFAKCGRSLDGHIKITGGEDDQAQPTEFPHMCVLFRLEGGTRVYIGGASLIARNKVVTVAHKFKVDKSKGAEEVDLTNSVEQFSVRCGEYNVKADSKIYETQETMVAAVIFHPLYNPKTVKNNLAILRTKENFIYQSHIGPVCLPRPKESFELGSKGKDCWSSGWGANSFEGSNKVYSDALKKVQLAVVPRDECEERMRRTDRFKGKGFRLHESWMCIGGLEGEDTCSGDGGSPHVCRSDRGWTQVGAVAWGVECGMPVPSVYSSIPDAMCWIDYVMSCYGEADTSINNLDAGSFNLRGTGDTAESVNAISPIDCQEWMDNNVELGNRCTVIYGASIDERNVG